MDLVTHTLSDLHELILLTPQQTTYTERNYENFDIPSFASCLLLSVFLRVMFYLENMSVNAQINLQISTHKHRLLKMRLFKFALFSISIHYSTPVVEQLEVVFEAVEKTARYDTEADN